MNREKRVAAITSLKVFLGLKWDKSKYFIYKICHTISAFSTTTAAMHTNSKRLFMFVIPPMSFVKFFMQSKMCIMDDIFDKIGKFFVLPTNLNQISMCLKFG